MSKQLTFIEAKLTSTLITRIEAWVYDYGESLKYVSIDYDKQSDGVLVSFLEGEDSQQKRLSLREAEFVTWLIPQVRSLETNNNCSIESIKIIYDAKGLLLDILEVSNATE
ncbi:hypothetical protein [Acinetobacter stercoris]|uniref:Uncharacterized protein n=1 Tax=Acinetobacter stercoris TaxID=2126983 RepID=A0A2U3MV13_9GAMM|nr:hypothetical protein [Acinetobacter stercoris]SPL69139.1 hypothetical protein KPC_0317 [Acinetobacter stercoris]